MHVHDDESGPPRRRPRRCRASPDRAITSARVRAERRQGRAIGKASENSNGGSDRSSCIPDVKRMLMRCVALTAAARTICYATAWRSTFGAGQDAKTRGEPRRARAVDADRKRRFSTDIGNEVTSLACRFHGGMGFIEETGAAQHYPRRAHHRDLRRHQRHPVDRSVTRKLAANGGSRCGRCSTNCLRSSAKVESLQRSRIRHPGANCANGAGSR